MTDGKILVHVATHGARVVGFVTGAANVARLRSEVRLVGVPVGRARATIDGDDGGNAEVQLAMEEIAVGVVEGHVRLVAADEDGDAEARYIEDAMRRIVMEPLLDCSGLVWDAIALLRVRVFADLWRRGHFVAFGSKFGVDFLLYEHDPATCHSFAMVIVNDYLTPFATVDVVSHCRVAKMVKKRLLLASQQDATIVYLSLDHAVLAAAHPARH